MSCGGVLPTVPVVPVLLARESEAVATNPTAIFPLSRATVPSTIETRTTTYALGSSVVRTLLADVRALRKKFGVVPTSIPMIQGSVPI